MDDITRSRLQQIIDQPGVLNAVHLNRWRYNRHGKQVVVGTEHGQEFIPGLYYTKGAETKVPKNMGKIKRNKK